MSQQSDPAHVVMPGVHRIASLLQRWLLGTHQGAVTHVHLDAYLNEFTFRFNRRRSRRRGLLFFRLLQQAVAADPITYRSLIVNRKPTGRRPSHASRPGRVATTEAAHRPWRQSQQTWGSLTQIDTPLREIAAIRSDRRRLTFERGAAEREASRPPLATCSRCAAGSSASGWWRMFVTGPKRRKERTCQRNRVRLAERMDHA
jgi:hypothetical protein